MSQIGVLHPGEMGISVAVSAMNSGHQLCWASENRGGNTKARAEKYGLIDVYSIAELCQHCQIILSVCPPRAAEDVARSVIENGFHGLYLEANAIAPQRSMRIATFMEAAGIRFVEAESSVGRHGGRIKRGFIYRGRMQRILLYAFRWDLSRQKF